MATDGRGGAGALRAARRLAQRSGTPVRVLTVCEPLPAYFGALDYSRVPRTLPAERRAAQLDGVRRQLHDVLGPDTGWRVEARDGDPAPVVAEAAADADAALVVVGAGRHGLLDRVLGAETALGVVRHADRPVLVVPDGADPVPRTVVVATDFDATAAHAAEAALALVADGGTLHLVHAWDPDSLAGIGTAGAGVSPAPPASPDLQRLIDAYAAGLPDRFARVREVLTARSDVRVATRVVRGRPAAAVLTYAREHAADLVAVGRHAQGAVGRLFVGSVASAVVRGAECAVLVTPEPPAADAERLERALTGASTGTDPERWAAQLDAYTRRHAGRRAALSVEEDRAAAARSDAAGYLFLGASYDPHDRRLVLMLGTPQGGGPHLTRTIGDVRRVTVEPDDRGDRPAGRETLLVRHGGGQTRLTLLPDATRRA